MAVLKSRGDFAKLAGSRTMYCESRALFVRAGKLISTIEAETLTS